MNLHDDFAVDAFIRGYVASFETFDAQRVATFYHVPCISVRADGSVHCFESESETELFFATVLEAYSKEGMAEFAAIDLVLEQMGSAACRLECTWRMKREDNSLIRDWRQSDVFQHTAVNWKIVASVFHV